MQLPAPAADTSGSLQTAQSKVLRTNPDSLTKQIPPEHFTIGISRLS